MVHGPTPPPLPSPASQGRECSRRRVPDRPSGASRDARNARPRACAAKARSRAARHASARQGRGNPGGSSGPRVGAGRSGGRKLGGAQSGPCASTHRSSPCEAAGGWEGQSGACVRTVCSSPRGAGGGWEGGIAFPRDACPLPDPPPPRKGGSQHTALITVGGRTCPPHFYGATGHSAPATACRVRPLRTSSTYTTTPPSAARNSAGAGHDTSKRILPLASASNGPLQARTT